MSMLSYPLIITASALHQETTLCPEQLVHTMHSLGSD